MMGRCRCPECVPDLAALVADAAPRCGSTRLVCIDGPAGSGKTTLAEALSQELGGAPVVHMDDLYEGWAQSLGDPLAARVEAWLLVGWEVGSAGHAPEVRLDPRALRRMGDGPGRPGRDPRGVRQRVRADPGAVQPRRLGGGAGRAAGSSAEWSATGRRLAPQWREWQAHEQAHFATDGTRAAADVIVDGVSGQIRR